MPTTDPDDDTDAFDGAWHGDLALADDEATQAGETDDLPDAPRTAPPITADAEALAALVRRVMDQDQAALAALYEALSGRVYACALRMTRQVAMAEEVTQDTFWQVWRQAPRFDPQRGQAQVWVLNITRSRALDALRARKRERLHAEALAHDEPEALDTDPLDLVDGLQRDTRLQLVLARLDPLKRQLIALAYYRGLTQDEIAVQTGMPLGTVKSHLRRTLAALRAALGSETSEGLDAA